MESTEILEFIEESTEEETEVSTEDFEDETLFDLENLLADQEELSTEVPFVLQEIDTTSINSNFYIIILLLVFIFGFLVLRSIGGDDKR